MWNQIFEQATQTGIWSALFVGLFVYQLKDSKIREQKYQQTIKELGDSLKIVGAIKEDVECIKGILTK
ncbi:MAG: BhlA/UviB family holin-like peptide [Christensenellales bacterium]|jgi:hypothetical protein